MLLVIPQLTNGSDCDVQRAGLSPLSADCSVPSHVLGSQVPFEDQVNTRLTYMPLFTGRVKLYKPKSNDIKHKTNTFSTEQEKSIRYKGETSPSQTQNLSLYWQPRTESATGQV